MAKEHERIARLHRRLRWLATELRESDPERQGRRIQFIRAEASALRWALGILDNLYPVSAAAPEPAESEDPWIA